MKDNLNQDKINQNVATAQANPKELPPKTAKLSPSYRPDIDGLRAIAVIAVIINHFNPALITSGFLGVDIFYVISGFVVTASLAKKIDLSWKDYLLTFYSRRIKRLFPALATCVVITSIIGCLFIYRPGTSLQTGIAALLGLSNLYLFQESTDYFGQSAELNLFTHTWSLGVEEQFYLIFPILLGICGFSQRRQRKGGRNLFVVVLFLSVVSLIGYLYLAQTNVAAAFFLMPARFWELGVGCLTLFAVHRFGSYHFNRLKAVAAPLSSLLLVGVLWLSKDLQTGATVAIALLTCFVIWSFDSKSFLVRIFSHDWLVQVGRLSYSLYLWHWSVLVLSRWTIGVNRWTIPGQLLLIVVLAVASYYLIEKPSRYAQWAKTKGKTIGYGLLISFTSILLLLGLNKPWQGKLYTGNFGGITSHVTTYLLGDRLDVANTSISRANCSDPNQKDILSGKTFQLCAVAGEPEQPKIYLYGDSQADALKPLLGRLHFQDHLSIETVSQNSSPFPFLNYKNNQGYSPTKAEQVSAILQQRLSEQVKAGDIVFAAVYLSHYFTDPQQKIIASDRTNGQVFYADDRSQVTHIEAMQIWLDHVADLANQLESKQASLVVLATIPEFEWEVNPTSEICKQQWFRPSPPATCAGKTQDKQELLRRHQHINEALEAIAAKHPNLYVYKPFDLLCPGETCSTSLNGELIYRDYSHLSYLGAEYLHDDFTEFLKENSLL
jgi:peptidoglycan/LPS O-acetylase OafA/YrhL